jgi:hypothetical protein
MGSFLPHLLQRGVEVLAADYDPSVIANAPSGVTIHHGASTLDLIKHVPLVLATGMSLATDTLLQLTRCPASSPSVSATGRA